MNKSTEVIEETQFDYDDLFLNIKKDIQSKRSVLFVENNTYKSEIVLNLISELKFKHACYVTLNKTYDILARSLDSKRVDINKFYFIDGITSVILETKSKKNVLFLNSQYINEVETELNNLFKEKIDLLIIDSISSLLVYNSLKDVLKFTETILKNVSIKNTKILLLVLKKDWKEIKKLEKVIDTVIVI